MARAPALLPDTARRLLLAEARAFAPQEQRMESPIFKLTAIAALSIVVTATSAVAQTTATRPAGGETAGTSKAAAGAQLAEADRKFVERAATGGIAEVEMGKLAQQKASSDQVKEFGARMVQDHGNANDELKQLAQAKGIAVPAAPTKAQHGDMEKLNKLSGAKFDQQYMAHMVSDHRKTVAEFKKASESAKDSELKAFAGKTLPTLQEHMAQAESIHGSVKSASK
jgi:putative membrane protein